MNFIKQIRKMLNIYVTVKISRGEKVHKKKNTKLRRVMLQTQTILQYFYKILIWLTSYWFSLGPQLISFFSFTNNHSSNQQFVKKFVK